MRSPPGTQRIHETRSFQSGICTIFSKKYRRSSVDLKMVQQAIRSGSRSSAAFTPSSISDVSDIFEQRRTKEVLGEASLSACGTRSGARFGPRQKTSERSRLVCQRQRIEYDPSSQLSREVRQPCARQHDRQRQGGKEERPGASCQPTVLADGGYP